MNAGNEFRSINEVKADSSATSILVRSTPLDPVALLWRIYNKRPLVVRVFFSRPHRTAQRAAAELFPDASRSACSEIEAVFDDIEAFLNGEDIVFPLDTVRLDLCSEFQRSVLTAEHGIPRGAVDSYANIAVRVGKPGGARAVGSALARNPFPIIIPCHRAVRSDGSIGGFQGGTAMKRTLLQMEGILFDGHGRIAAPAFIREK
jgi:methylated-DNA-[protein]-cysteine S-methyltransferase